MTIPKILHYCWFGRSPLSELSVRCLESWREVMPEYSIVQWNEDNLYSESPYVKAAYQKKRYAFVADYMRLWALYNEGGIYMDTDVEMVKPFDDLLGEKIFLGRQSPTSVGVGVIGATKGHPFLKRIMDSLDAEAMSGRITFMPLPELVDSLLASSGNEDITILPEDCCYPYNPYSPEVIRRKPLLSNMSDKTICVHHWEGSWLGEISLKTMLHLRIRHTIGKAKAKVRTLSFRRST
ncbi:glycosyltransferase family 32 protein [Skermanella aerolata]|uniref:glycosyltransferase family 32 protein n=1 Tax=Skermanella aerolata TaxID=393310 RepID=UPI0024528CF1|nr:glycosyltransferase [Skermanella aerolata]